MRVARASGNYRGSMCLFFRESKLRNRTEQKDKKTIRLSNKPKEEREQTGEYKEIKESQKATDGSRNKKKQHRETASKGAGA